MSKQAYTILPFNFRWVNENTVLLVNSSGDYHFLNHEEFDLLLQYRIDSECPSFHDLKSKHFLCQDDVEIAIKLSATKLRSKKQFLQSFTALHMMVITVRCNHDCRYCHASSVDDDAVKYDMTPETAIEIVKQIFQTPSTEIKIEFQGGEPLLNWKTIVATVEYAEKLNEVAKKKVEFVICTNLTLIDDEKLEFINLHDISVSTSLDGTKQHHDQNRIMRNGRSSYDIFIEKLQLTRSKLKDGVDVGPLMTTSRGNLHSLQNVVDEYVKLGFHGVFLRALNPYGFASDNQDELGYSMDEFLCQFKQCLDYIINLNLQGHYFVEYYTALLLSRILTPFSTGFVDLQSPSGAGISGVIYDYNGDVYPADEARMLNRMGDSYFCMGNVLTDDYQKIFHGKVIKEIVKNSCVEILPGCFSCAYSPYCGADPVRNYLETTDIIGKRPSSDFCKKHMGILDIIFEKLLNKDEDEIDVFWSWLTKRSLKEIRSENACW